MIYSREMVNFQITKRLATSLYNAGTQFIPSIQAQLHNRLLLQQEARSKLDGTQQPMSTEYLVRNWVEAVFAWIQMIVLWHDPILSIFAISSILSTFLLLTYFTPRFYATVMIIVFIHNLTKVWFKHVWPEIRVPPEDEAIALLNVERWTHLHPQLITLNEFGQLLENLLQVIQAQFEKLMIFRRREPIRFCVAMCSILSCTAYVGNQFSDTSLILGFMILVLITPGIYLYILPQSLKEQISKTIRDRSSKKQNQDDSELAEPHDRDGEISSTSNMLTDLLVASTTTEISSHNTVANEPSSTSRLSILSSPLTFLGNLAGSKSRDDNEPAKQSSSNNDSDGDPTSPSPEIIDQAVSDDDGPTRTPSPIDFEEEQQDGFVIL